MTSPTCKLKLSLIPLRAAVLGSIFRRIALCIALALTGCSTQDAANNTNKQRNQTYSGKRPNAHVVCVVDWEKAPPLPPDVWSRIQSRYQLKYQPNNPRITTERNWYANHQAYLNRTSGRASRYIYHVANELEKRNLPGELALLPIVESAYNPFAYSRSRASGLWQFIPGTAKHLNMDIDWWYDQRRDVPGATKYALDYLVFLRNHYDGDWLKALAAYNAGWGTIDKAVARNKAKGLPTDYWSLDVPAETAAYVPKLLALAQITQNPYAYGVHWAYIPDLPYFSNITLSQPIDIAHAASLAGISSDELYLLNPGLNRCATPPNPSHQLLVPIDHAPILESRIALLTNNGMLPQPDQLTPAATNPNVQAMEDKVASSKKIMGSATSSYKVRSGDTLSQVAQKHGMDATELRKLNGLSKGESLSLGNTLAVSTHTSTPIKTAHVTQQAVRVKKQAYITTASSHPAKNKVAVRRATTQHKPAITQTLSSKKIASTKSSLQNRQHTNKTHTQKARYGKAQKNKTAYTVQRGDTLVLIAKQHQLSPNDIARWNDINKGLHVALQPGKTITLYQ